MAPQADMIHVMNRVGIVDIFSGPGGLGEGFCPVFAGTHWPFRMAVSVEKDRAAYETLLLRSFLRKFNGKLPSEYYDVLNGSVEAPDWGTEYPGEWGAAVVEARRMELGDPGTSKFLESRVSEVQEVYGDNTVLIGGPPCQAYSLAGRVRNAAVAGYLPDKDDRNLLYQKYIEVLKLLEPAFFVMENVKGMLSASVRGERVFKKVMSDLRSATAGGYELVALAPPNGRKRNRQELAPRDFVVRAEDHGVPQARHRVFIAGMRRDIAERLPRKVWPRLRRSAAPSIGAVIGTMPRLRSGLSRRDALDDWLACLDGAVKLLRQNPPQASRREVRAFRTQLKLTEAALREDPPDRRRGEEFGLLSDCPERLRRWLRDSHLKNLPNNETRGHMPSDLARYLFAAVFAAATGRSPKAPEFPDALAPEHQNWRSGKFTDRFRVQVKDRPGTTVTSHISKDGHYYIHFDPSQCRSLTVREAARLQTFPDNYLFKGTRTEQYVQVGNAVPPFLAHQIARCFARAFSYLAENTEQQGALRAAAAG